MATNYHLWLIDFKNVLLEITLSKFILDLHTKIEEFGEKIIDYFGIIGVIDLINASYLILFKMELY